MCFRNVTCREYFFCKAVDVMIHIFIPLYPVYVGPPSAKFIDLQLGSSIGILSLERSLCGLACHTRTSQKIGCSINSIKKVVCAGIHGILFGPCDIYFPHFFFEWQILPSSQVIEEFKHSLLKSLLAAHLRLDFL